MKRLRLLWWFYIGLILPFIFIPLLSHAASGDYVEEGKVIETPLEYDTHPTFTGDEQLVDKKYVDDTAISTMTYPGAGIPLSTGSAWGTSITNNSTNWNTAYGWGNHASAGYVTGTPWTSMGYLTSEVDGSTTNEIQDLSLAGNTLSLSGDGTTVNLAKYLDNTDAQDLSLSGDTLSLTGDASTVSLSGYYNSLSDLQGSVTNDFHNLGGTDANTTYTASGTLLNLSSTTFSVKEGTLTNGKYCTYVTGTGLVCNSDSGSMTYPDAGIPLSTGSAWGSSITNNSANWNTAYGWGNHASAGYLTGSTGIPVSSFTADGQVLVGTGNGTFAAESGATLRTSLGLGTGNTPQFTGLNLTTGELTTGSINRATGTLTLEIAGSPMVSISNTESYFNENLIIKDNAYVGSYSSYDALQILWDGTIKPKYGIDGGTTELTIGSINRTSGSLTLEIGGIAEQTISATETTFGGNLVIKDNAYIGSASDTDAMRIEADGDVVLTQGLSLAGTKGIGVYAAPSPQAGIYVGDSSFETTFAHYGINVGITKTGGITDYADTFIGMQSSIGLNQSGGVLGAQYGAVIGSSLYDGTIGESGANKKSMYGAYTQAYMNGGTVTGDAIGLHTLTNLDAGTVEGDVFGDYTNVDIEADVTSIGGNVYGQYINIDVDKDPVGTAYGLYLNTATNVDYAFYHNGTAPSVLNGSLFINTTSAIGSEKLRVNGDIYSDGAIKSASDITINSDLENVTSKLIFGRTTGENGEISYDGAQLGFNKSLYVPTHAPGGNTYAIKFYQDATPQSYGIGMGPTKTEGMVNYYAAYPWGTTGAVFGHRFYAGAYERLRVTANGNIYIPGQVLINTTSFIGTEKLRVNGNEYLDGTLTVAGGQIVFPATQNASSNANTLDDYEEGTYTPTVTSSVSGGYKTGTYATLSYTKIGNKVTITGGLSFDSENSPNGYMEVSLPFTAKSGKAAEALGICYLSYDGGLLFGSAHVGPGGTSKFWIREYSGGYFANTTGAINGSSTLTVTLTYIAAN